MTGGETRSIHTSDIQKTPFRVSRRVARCRREAFDETAARRLGKPFQREKAREFNAFLS